MSGIASNRIRLGIVGLGRVWETRHKPALTRMKDRFQVTAVYDQVARRAEIEANAIGARALDGLTALVEQPNVDAVAILAPQWFGSQPIELAARSGKPVYCGLPLVDDLEGLDRLARLVNASGIAFMSEFAPRFYPATIRLRELLGSTLGRPRAIVGTIRLIEADRNEPPGPGSQVVPGPLLVDPGQSLMDWARFVVGAELGSTQVWTESGGPAHADEDQVGIIAHLASGASARFVVERYQKSLWGDADRFLPRPGIQVLCDRGAAFLEWPDLIHWTDGSTNHQERIPSTNSLGETLFDQFERMIRGEEHSAPTWADALSAASSLAAFGFEGRTEPGPEDEPSSPGKS